MTEFEVGDKVDHGMFGRGIVTYGPLAAGTNEDRQPSYVALMDSDKAEHILSASYLTALPAFSVGDKALSGGTTVELIAGPFKGYGEWYVIKDTDGRELQVLTSYLKPVPAPDPEPEPVKPFAMRGITYDLNARYEDKDGDAWHFDVIDGTVRGEMRDWTVSRTSNKISRIVDDYGPLRKV